VSLAPGRLDWRWAKASEVAEYTDSQAVYHLRGADAATVDAYRFKRAVDRGEPWPDTPTAAAYELFIQPNRFEERLFVEGMLLAGAKNEDFAAKVPCAPADVQAYHDLFFDVRPRLEAPAWIVGQLFHGGLYGPMNLRDRAGVVHRLAWMAGPQIFEAYATGNQDPALREKMAERIKDIVAKQSLISSMCLAGHGGEVDIEVLRVFIDVDRQIKETVKNIGADESSQAVLAEFVRSVPFKVADPTDVRNLTLPAIEPRAADYLATPEVKDVTPIDVR
jgi:hypothetical protein